jgi:hypothetical protein
MPMYSELAVVEQAALRRDPRYRTHYGLGDATGQTASFGAGFLIGGGLGLFAGLIGGAILGSYAASGVR